MAISAPHFLEESEDSEGLKKVIVVDDNEILLRAWKRILSREGCLYFTTSNPEEALERLETVGADLVISDIVMPGMDGFELVQQIQHLKKKPIIVFTTGYVCDFKRLKLDLHSENIHVLVKPYNDIQEIGRFIHGLLYENLSQNDPSDILQTLDNTHIHLWHL